MRQKVVEMIVLTLLAQTVVLSLVLRAQPQEAGTHYPNMAPLDQYLMADGKAKTPWREARPQNPFRTTLKSWSSTDKGMTRRSRE
jgi:hypothetical protein